MKQLTEQQKQKSEQRKEAFRKILEVIKSKTDEELEKDFDLIVNPSGHSLTLRNSALAFEQSFILGLKPPTVVAGFKQWLEVGRKVKKGGKGVDILIPCQTYKKDEQGNKIVKDGVEELNNYFKYVTVFDITQTEEIEQK